MNRAVVFASVASVILIGAAAVPSSTTGTTPAIGRVQVHCPAGPNAAFVTPVQIRIAVGDSLEWRSTGQVVADSIFITLKDPEQAWPFAGNSARGGQVAMARGAHARGTYAYNVRMLCRLPGGGTREVIIDPDIIIE